MTGVRVRIRTALVLALAGALVAGACGSTPEGTPQATFPLTTDPPNRTTTPDLLAARAVLATALGATNVILADTEAPFRPAEGAILTTAPRAVYQAVMPADPGKGFIAVYDLEDAGRAAAAAQDQAAYLASGPGRVQYPDATQHILRVLDTTVIFYSWAPEGAVDPKAPDVAAAIETVGQAVAIPG